MQRWTGSWFAFVVEQIRVGRARTDDDGCRRYLPHAISFDTRALLLGGVIDPEWEPRIIAQHEMNRDRIRTELLNDFGVGDGDRKVEDFRALGAAPWSVADEHNTFMGQVRDAFTLGAYYPALVGACALGERLLNELVIRLRGDYKDHLATTPELAKHKSFSDWAVCISALYEWGVIDDPLATKFNDLRKWRNKSVHYGTHLAGTNARDDALEAVLLVQGIVQGLFNPHGGPPQFIDGISGHSFIALDAEEQPFIREFILPASMLLSPTFESRFDPTIGWFAVFDDERYQEEFPTLSDEEFADHRNNQRRAP